MAKKNDFTIENFSAVPRKDVRHCKDGLVVMTPKDPYDLAGELLGDLAEMAVEALQEQAMRKEVMQLVKMDRRAGTAVKIPWEGLASITKAYNDSEGQFFVEGYAATSDVDSDNEMITPEAMALAAQDLLKNSTVLENHDPGKRIGKVLSSVAEGGKLKVKVLISKTVPDTWKQIREGVLNKFSIRGDILEAKSMFFSELSRTIRVILKMSLIECSLVSLPANANASVLNAYVSKSRHWGKVPVYEMTLGGK
jgi:Caudovirus prohead protease.